jgi:hypothetical protein
MQPIQPASPGQPLRASDLNAQSAEMRRQGNTFFEGGTLSQESGGVHLSADAPNGFWAQLTGRDRFKYSWVEVQKSSVGLWDFSQENKQKGTTSFNFAFEINYSIAVPIGTVVYLSQHSSITIDDQPCNIYTFTFSEFGGDGMRSGVVTDVVVGSSGINLVKTNFQAYNYNANFSPTILACSDLIPKSLVGQSNRVLTVNQSETGFEFGASVAPYTGLGPYLADITTLKSDVENLKIARASLVTDVTTLKADVATLKDDVTTLKTQMTSLTARVTALE